MCQDWAISIRRACGALDLDRSTHHYTSRRADQAGLERRIREICETRVRYGYRRVHVLLERESWGANIKRTYRIYRDLGLQLRNKTPKRRVKPSCGRIGKWQSDPMMSGRWTLFTTSSPPARSYAFCRSGHLLTLRPGA